MKEKTRKEKIWQSQEKAAGLALNGAALFAYLLAVVIFPVAFVMRPFRRLRIGLLYSNAMGRFYGNTEYFLRERKLHIPKKADTVFLVSRTATVNEQILKMVARHVRIVRGDAVWNALAYLRKLAPQSPIWIDMGCTGWLRGAEWSVPGPQLSFTPEEHQRGKEILRRIGIPDGAAYVCFFAKDRLYTDSPDTKLDPQSYWGSRDFRNCDIRNYVPAVQYLAEQGIYAVRMGIHPPEERLPRGLGPRIIDYTAELRPGLDDPDFADAYLQATCKFFLGTTSGIYLLSSMFGVPVAYANMIPYGECGRMPHDIVIFKKCRDRSTNALLPFPYLIARGIDADWLTLEELAALDEEGIEFVENTGDEILELVREMNMRLDGTWQRAPEDDALQAKAQTIFTARAFDGSGFPGRIGADFLRRYRNLLDDSPIDASTGRPEAAEHGRHAYAAR